MEKIRILVADDHPTFGKGLCRMLGDEEDFECIGLATDGQSAVAQAKKLKPDVAILDVSMPRLNGPRAAKEIHKVSPKTAIIMLTAFDYEAFILASLRAGARGYMLKTVPLEKLVNAIRMVHKGESVLDIKATHKLVQHLQYTGDDGEKGGKKRAGAGVLHSRELEVLRLAARGMSNKEIAGVLKLSERTIQTHLVNIFKKLGASSRTQAVLSALREGWIELEETPG
jgi:DNA-binding NarL/FixJ family response regulator